GTERTGGWVRFGSGPDGESHAILQDFLRPARESGRGIHLKNLYNSYVYFWRWALWKVLDSTSGPGIISFITAASYLRGPGFVGMREQMRRDFDDLWILDLEGDSLGARKTQNVFNIQTPVCIAVGVRGSQPHEDEPARVHYARLEGTREEKLRRLAELEAFSELTWQDCPSGWQAPFLPRSGSDYHAWPKLTDLFPWQHSGVQVKRTWPIGETREVLQARWKALLGRTGEARRALFKETRDRKTDRLYPSLDPSRPAPGRLSAEEPGGAAPEATHYGWRSFDRRFLLADARVIDYPRPPLWRSNGPRQMYLSSLMTKVLGPGPAATLTELVPDLDYFCGRGGKDVIPLFRDAAGTVPNVTHGLLGVLGEGLGVTVSAGEFLAYVYAVLSSPDYARRFSEEVTMPGPRIPVTRDAGLFRRAVEVGSRLVALHTFGERAIGGEPWGDVPRGSARNTVSVPQGPEGYPVRFGYDASTGTLHVGEGEFAPVRQEVWEYSVSGFQVVKSWLAYRMRERSGRSSSPLDEIRPDSWTSEMTRELLRVLWVLEGTVELQPALNALLDEVAASPCFAASDLPVPTEEERDAPGGESAGSQGSLF
ncbi:MAG TPA: type ISP restriction/modification enzyme, partial [Deinococcales bacterium]|nr:type ISP restriction/modification enzyme [Deinococcales bacterium]